jgi:hypothetical protein
MAEPGLFSFFAGAPANSPTSYQGMEARRRIALQLLANSKKGYPKTIGEGLTAVGDAIGDRAVLNQLAQQEAAYQKQAAAAGAGLIPSEAQTPGPSSSEDTTPPAPARTSYASPESDTQAAPVLAGYRPPPAYLQAALAQDVADPERRAYLGQLAGKEAQSADEVSSTGAAGPFQFTRGTGAQYGLMPGGQDMRGDIHASIAAAQNLTDDNVATLTRMLGRAPSPGEMALAHQQGAVTAGRMLTGAGNAPASNLAVNNVNPGASPQAAAAKIMGYYGMPSASANPRDALAATLAQRQGVPQPNPTEAGPSAALPLSGSATPPGGAADLPPEILTGASAIRSAPPPPSQIQTAPQQLAQAQPATPQVVPRITPQPRVALPQEPPMTDDEKRGWKAMAGARALGDPELIAQAQALIASGAAQRKQQYDIRIKNWQDEVATQRQRQLAEEQRAFEEPERQQRMAAQKQALEQSAITPPPPGPPPQQMAGPGVPGGGDPRLGTPLSPQRTGVPAAPPVPPGISPAQHAQQQAPILTQAVQAVDKATPEFQRALAEIQAIRNHPGKAWGLGVTGPIAGQFPTEAKDFLGRVEQLKNQTFLQAYNTLRGGGQISNVEGEKAQQAQARLDPKNTKGFDTALADLEKQLRGDLEIAQRKVNRPVTAWPVRGAAGISPDIGERRGDWQFVGGAPDNPDSWRRVQ